MYEFHYDFMKNEVKIFTLLYTDTVSFIYKIIGEDFDEIMHKHKEIFDLSNQPKDKKVPGIMKDEYAGIPIYKYIGIKPKMYSIRNVYNYEKSVYKEHSSDILMSIMIINNIQEYYIPLFRINHLVAY